MRLVLIVLVVASCIGCRAAGKMAHVEVDHYPSGLHVSCKIQAE